MEGIYFTRHAKARMRWRQINKDEVIEVLRNPGQIEIIGENRFYYFKQIGIRYLRVTCVIEFGRCVIVSVVDKSD